MPGTLVSTQLVRFSPLSLQNSLAGAVTSIFVCPKQQWIVGPAEKVSKDTLTNRAVGSSCTEPEVPE